jgi:hypothetical protein
MINDFLGTMGKRGFSKPTLFRVSIEELPLAMSTKQGVSEIWADLEFFAETAEFPGTQILTQELRHYDMPAKFAYGKAHDDLTITFRLDRDFQVKQFFDMWVDTIYDRKTGDISYKKKYYGKILVAQLNEDGESSYLQEVHDCFPTSIGQISLGWDQQGVYSKLPVTFSFRKLRTLLSKKRFFESPQYDFAVANNRDSQTPGSLLEQGKNTLEGYKTTANTSFKQLTVMDKSSLLSLLTPQ